jgi:hypothetical protein
MAQSIVTERTNDTHRGNNVAAERREVEASATTISADANPESPADRGYRSPHTSATTISADANPESPADRGYQSTHTDDAREEPVQKRVGTRPVARGESTAVMQGSSGARMTSPRVTVKKNPRRSIEALNGEEESTEGEASKHRTEKKNLRRSIEAPNGEEETRDS